MKVLPKLFHEKYAGNSGKPYRKNVKGVKTSLEINVEVVVPLHRMSSMVLKIALILYASLLAVIKWKSDFIKSERPYNFRRNEISF